MQLELSTIESARRRIAPHVRLTPVVEWAPKEIDAKVTLKLEFLQIGGSFKARGACNRLLTESTERLARGVVTASGGNHGLGVAYAATRVGATVTVYLPETAPLPTEQRLARLGARSVRGGAAWDDAWRAAIEHAEADGALAVHPFEDDAVIAGQGTVGLELAEQTPGLDAALVAIGGGGLVAGVATALRRRSPGLRVIGVEAEGAPSMKRAVDAGRVVTLDEVRTIAGTLAPRAVGPNTLSIVAKEVADIVLVSDDEMRAAMRRLWEDLRVLVEPAGAAAVAALLSGRAPLEGARSIGVVLCGSNLDPALAANVVA